VVKAANPFSGVTLALLKAKHGSPTMTPNHWDRMVCNRPARDVDSWLGKNGDAIWAALTNPFQLVPKAQTWVGVDVGLKRDSTAVVVAQYRPDEPGQPTARLHLKCRLWIPKADDPVDATEVMQHIRDLDELYDLQAVSYDPRFFDVPAKFLFDEGLPMMEIPQSLERMTMAVGDLYQAVLGGKVTHDGDTAFTGQVMNAQPRFNERGFTLAKGKSRGRIDAAVAAALAVDRALRQEPSTSVYEERGVVTF
jgi:phage terminase large subunit-like protein